MEANSFLFGKLVFETDKILHFPDGVPGFPDKKNYIIYEKEESKPIAWLQSVDDPYLAFAVINPVLIIPDYSVCLTDEDCQLLQLDDKNDVLLLSIMVLPEDLNLSTVNLQAPLVINIKERLGKQVITANESYPHRYNLFSSKECNKSLNVACR